MQTLPVGLLMVTPFPLTGGLMLVIGVDGGRGELGIVGG